MSQPEGRPAPHADRPLTAAEQVAAPPRRGRESHGVRVLEVDEKLGRWLEGERLKRARSQLLGRVLALPKGEWDVATLHGAGPLSTGMLLVEGFVARELLMDARVSIELFGPGDLLRPWEDEASLLPIAVRWNVLSPARALVLGTAFSADLREYPEVSAVLFERMHERAQRLAETQAISQATHVETRLHAMFWHLADRWGRVTADGIVVPLALSHRMLSELVGARRPTVSTGLAELARRGTLTRSGDGCWLLSDASPPRRAAAPQRLVPARRRLFQPDRTASLADARERSEA